MLNRKFKGKPLPKTDWVVKDFIIMPDEHQNRKTFDMVVFAMGMNLPIPEIEAALNDMEDLEIRLRFTNTEMDGFYYPHQFAFSHKDLGVLNFAK